MIDIFFEEIETLTELNPDFYESWLDQVANLEKKKLGDISLIFTSDEHLLTVNQQYLDHDYYTDIITFDYSEDDFVSGDLFISVDRVSENAVENNVSFLHELNRVVVHGVLHLCGYKDKSESEEQMMRAKEDQMLQLI
ncbi:rRNA maturation RNase YbeY [Crocinitomicaceae bacterium CZZ-1]|uniref:Endoribonuclease YbeY n=1 Tax=Taishania pollutisoli TaxID=2766479 RepID=A0A8J6PI74_9FLAO|nr:rRNA maturation RNase YbeY [Taishania pollutisoli]MBC9812059.1 rRNA maturation RNase YbeY [Taishania pollutisoli]